MPLNVPLSGVVLLMLAFPLTASVPLLDSVPLVGSVPFKIGALGTAVFDADGAADVEVATTLLAGRIPAPLPLEAEAVTVTVCVTVWVWNTVLVE